MFFVINPMNCYDKDNYYSVSSLDDSQNYFVLDTDDLKVEKVSYKKLFDILHTNLSRDFVNVALTGNNKITIIKECYDIGDYSEEFNCMNGLVHISCNNEYVYQNDTITISENKYHIKVIPHIIIEGDGRYFSDVKITINDKVIGVIELDFDNDYCFDIVTSIAYVFRLNDMIVTRLVYYIIGEGEYTSNFSIYFDTSGKLITVEALDGLDLDKSCFRSECSTFNESHPDYIKYQMMRKNIKF